MPKFNALHAALLAFCVTYTAPNAHACSMNACEPGEAFPIVGEVPQNALAWFVRESKGDYTLGDAGLVQHPFRVFAVTHGDAGPVETELELVTLEDNAPNSINAADQRFVASSAVPVGTRLRVERVDVCEVSPKSSTLVVAPPAVLPSTLGTLDVRDHFGPLELMTYSGSCTEPRDARYVDVTIQLARGTKPYADVLRYFLLVDGKPYRNTDWQWLTSEDVIDTLRRPTIAGSALGAGVERVFAVCSRIEQDQVGDGEGVGEGDHEVQMIALLPDGTALESEIRTVNLICPQDAGTSTELEQEPTGEEAGLDNEPRPTDEPTQGSEARDPSRPPTAHDAGLDARAHDAALDSRPRDAGKTELDAPRVKSSRARDSGCSVAPSQPPRTASAAWVGLLLALSATWGRRHSARAQ